MRKLLSSTILLLLILVGLSFTSTPAQAQYYNPEICNWCNLQYNTSLTFCWLGYAFGGYDSVGYLDCTTQATWAYNDCAAMYCMAANMRKPSDENRFAIDTRRSRLDGYPITV